MHVWVEFNLPKHKMPSRGSPAYYLKKTFSCLLFSSISNDLIFFSQTLPAQLEEINQFNFLSLLD